MAVYAKATYEYDAIDPGDLKFEEGDIIQVLEQEGDWWKGRINTREGYFPFNRVEILRNYNARTNQKPSFQASSIGHNPAESTSRITVQLENRKGSNGKPTYTVIMVLKNNQQVRDVKTMHDVRRFERTLRSLSPGYTFKSELSPEWADELPLSPTQCRDRAEHLQKFFNKNTEQRQLFDLVAITWCRKNKNQHRAGSPNPNPQISPNDSKSAIDGKITGALAAAYAKEDKDPVRWFFGKGSIGPISQSNFKWDARDNTEISFEAGDFLLIAGKQTQFEGWWYGQKIDGTKGFFPNNYVQEFDENTFREKMTPRTTRPGAPVPPKPVNQFNKVNTGFNQVNPAALGPPSGGAPPPSQNNGGERDRIVEKDFWVKSVEAYDELKSQGYCLEQQGRYLKAERSGAVNSGDFVTLSFSAYTWDPQSQQLREYSASDRLRAPPAGVQSGNAGRSGFMMEFVVGSQTAIEGLEQVVQCLNQNTPVRAIISPSMGYGDVGSPPEIPADCYLVYDLTLEKVASGTNYRPPRNQVFSVGITRNNIQPRNAMTSGAAWASQRMNNNVKRKKKRAHRPSDA